MPLQLAAFGLAGEPLTQLVHIGLDLRIGIGTVLGQHLLVGLLAFGEFGRLVHHRAFLQPGDRVAHGGRRATGQQRCGNQQGNATSTRRSTPECEHEDDITAHDRCADNPGF
jgi:hypothetical protein